MANFEGQELSVSTFSFNAELLQKNVYDPFMEATGCKLIVEGGKNAERVTKIKETPENYDVVIIGDAFVADLIDADLLEKTDYSALTNRDALYDNAKAPFGEEYGPAYTFNRLGIVYDKATCPIEITSWAICGIRSWRILLQSRILPQPPVRCFTMRWQRWQVLLPERMMMRSLQRWKS